MAQPEYARSGAAEPVLGGIVVVELGVRIAAGVAGSLLAQLGATVVVVEGEHRPWQRQAKWYWREQFVAGKLSIVPDWSRASDRELLAGLLRSCDVLLLSSDFATDAECAFVSESAVKDAIVCDVTAFGGDAPRGDAPYSDVEIQALTGIMEATGGGGGPPVPVGLPLVEYLAGISAAGGVLCALRHRRRAQSVQVALYDVGFGAMSSFLANAFTGNAASATRVGNRHTMAAPWNVYRARDGWLLLCSGSDDQWRRICKLIGKENLGASAEFAKNADRVARVHEVDGIVQAWVTPRTIAECVTHLGELGIPCGPVVAIDDYPREANLHHRGMVLRTGGASAGKRTWLPGSPLRMSGSPGAALLRIPQQDEHRPRVEALVSSGRRRAAVAGHEANRSALAGLRVIEIGHYTTAPVAARFLAAMGAEVIKIEPPGGEAVRRWPPAKNGQGVFFTFQNSDKKCVVLDLRAEADCALLKQLLTTADVLVENLRPGGLARRGFSPEEVLRINPRLVYCSISGFGADSLYPGRAAFDTVIQAMSGLMDVSHIDGMPLKTGPSFADLIGAAFGFAAVLAALEWRERTGRGQYLDLSMQDITAWTTQTAWNGRRPIPQQFQVLQCSDGFVLVDGAADDDTTIGMLRPRATSLRREDVVSMLSRSGLRAVPVLAIREAVAAPRTLERKLWFEAAADGASFPLLAVPMQLSRTPPLVRDPAPALGRDNEAIFGALRNVARRAGA